MIVSRARSASRGVSWNSAPSGLGQSVDRFGRMAALALVAWSVIAVQISPSPIAANPEATDTSGSTATPADATTAASDRELFVGFYGGAPYTYPSDVKIKAGDGTDLTLRKVEWIGQPFKAPIYYGVRVATWKESSPLGAMLDFTHSKAIAPPTQDLKVEGTIKGQKAPEQVKRGQMFRHLEFSHGHNMLTLNALGRLMSVHPLVRPYVGLGGGVSLPHTEVQLRAHPPRTYEYQYAGLVGQALAGIEIRLPKASVFFEYKFSYAPYRVPLHQREGSILPVDLWHQFQRWMSGKEPPQGWLTTQLTSHQINAGVGVRVSRTASPAAP